MKSLFEKLLPEIIEIRHQIHANPELAYEEKATASLVIQTLEKYGYSVESGIAGTGVTAILDSGRPGKTVALRADMDALPLEEHANLPYKSKNPGKMHACGHDGHTATLLLTAAVLKECKNEFKGKIKFIFQPAEEGRAGALAMIHAGVLENVDAIFGYHNSPFLPVGVIGTRLDCLMASMDYFDITIKGKGGHAAHPQHAIDPIYIGSLLVQVLQGIRSRFVAPADPFVLTVTQFQSGSGINIIPDEAKLTGTFRTVSIDTKEKTKKLIQAFCRDFGSTYGISIDVEFHGDFPPLINHADEAKRILKVSEKIFGKAFVKELKAPSMAAEDFAYFLQKIPGAFFFVGGGNEDAPLHSSSYNFNDAILPVASKALSQIAMDYLQG